MTEPSERASGRRRCGRWKMADHLWKTKQSSTTKFGQQPKRAMLCVCSVTRDCVFIDEKTENHILERHFNQSVNNTQDPWQAFFFEDVFSPEEIFSIVIHKLRNRLQSHEKSGNCYVSYVPFPFGIGYFPNQSHGPSVTPIVKVVCRYIVCQYCFKHCPSRVVTVHPWMPKRNWT